jgi:energy-coupling factor transport system ATP-binding protein
MNILAQMHEVERLDRNGQWHRCLDELTIRSGERIGIIGVCNSGKTAIAFLLAGVGDPRWSRGTVVLGGSPIGQYSRRDRSRRVALVPTDPSLVFSGLAPSLRDELELSLKVVGYGREYSASIQRHVDALSLGALLDRDPFSLSGGERVRAALAATLIKSPDLLVLDDIFSALDLETRKAVRACLTSMPNNPAVIELHSSAPSWIDKFDSCTFLCKSGAIQGRYDEVWRNIAKHAPELLPHAAQIAAELENDPKIRFKHPPATFEDLRAHDGLRAREIKKQEQPCVDTSRLDSSIAFLLRDWTFRYSPAGFRLGPLTLPFLRGRATAIIGPNGSGKTTLLRTISQLLPAQAGVMEIRNPDGSITRPPSKRFRHTWAKHVLYAFQNPDDQLFLPTVRRELAETAKICGRENYNEQVEKIAVVLMLQDVLERSPVDLPRPCRRLVTLGSCFVACPPILLLDEPTAGLDFRQKEQLGIALKDYLAARGTALVVSHDQEFVDTYCNQVVELEGGCVIPRRDFEAAAQT